MTLDMCVRSFNDTPYPPPVELAYFDSTFISVCEFFLTIPKLFYSFFLVRTNIVEQFKFIHLVYNPSLYVITNIKPFRGQKESFESHNQGNSLLKRVTFTQM